MTEHAQWSYSFLDVISCYLSLISLGRSKTEGRIDFNGEYLQSLDSVCLFFTVLGFELRA